MSLCACGNSDPAMFVSFATAERHDGPPGDIRHGWRCLKCSRYGATMRAQIIGHLIGEGAAG